MKTYLITYEDGSSEQAKGYNITMALLSVRDPDYIVEIKRIA